jgi:hypothetical protein
MKIFPDVFLVIRNPRETRDSLGKQHHNHRQPFPDILQPNIASQEAGISQRGCCQCILLLQLEILAKAWNNVWNPLCQFNSSVNYLNEIHIKRAGY